MGWWQGISRSIFSTLYNGRDRVFFYETGLGLKMGIFTPSPLDYLWGRCFGSVFCLRVEAQGASKTNGINVADRGVVLASR